MWHNSQTVATFTKEINLRLVQRLLNSNGSLAKIRLISSESVGNSTDENEFTISLKQNIY